MPLDRVLEPEVMDTEEEAREYDAMDHAEVNAAFCRDLLAMDPDVSLVLDLGAGTALIPIELCRRAPRARVVAIDAATSMARLAERNVENAALAGAIAVEIADAKALPYEAGSFSCVVSNSLLHHLARPEVAVAEMLRVLRPGGLLFVRDLVRPDSDDDVRRLVERYAASATPKQRALFDASLRAALGLDEVRAIAARLGLPPVAASATSDRHVTLACRHPAAGATAS